MIDKKVIFLPTVQNTGTWFMIETLLKHPDVKEFLEVRFFTDKKIGFPFPRNLKQSFSKNADTCVLQTHVHNLSGHNHAADYFFGALLCALPTIIPIRDPLGSMITMRERGMKREKRVVYDRMSNRVVIWKNFIADIQRYRNFTGSVCLMPLDLLRKQPVEQRQQAMRKMCSVVGLSRDAQFIKQASAWPMIHTLGTYDLKARYEAGRQRAMIQALGPVWDELCGIEKQTRPFFESLGYKNLMWWKDYKPMENAS